MLSFLVILGYIAAFTVPGLCCRSTEYPAKDGQCCPLCHEGTVVKRDCTQQAGTRCARCETGTYMDKPNGMDKCFTCSPCDQGHGLYMQQECTEIHDTVCDVLSGYFCRDFADNKGCSVAEKHKDCAPGQRIKEPGTSRNNTVCETCEPGYFSEDGLSCRAWTNCSETQKKIKEGSARSDVLCGTASRSHYSYIPLTLLILTLVGLLITGLRPSKTK